MSTTLVWTAVAVYAAVGLLIAWWARQGLPSGVEGYYLGGRRIGGVVSALSYAATTYSAFMMLGLAGLTYKGGVGALGFELVYFAGLGLVVIFGPRFWIVGRKWGFVTPSEMIGARYGSRAVAAVMAVLSCLFLIPYSSVQMLGMGYLLSGVTGGGIPFEAGLVLGAALVLVWTLVAGLRSVAWTDALQALVMLVSGVLAVWFIVDSLGGWGGFAGAVKADHAEWLTVPGPGLFSLTTFIAISVPWFFFSISNPQVSQRLFTTESLGAMRTMVIGFLCFGFIFTMISIVWGFAALAVAPGLDNPDLATPTVLGTGVVPAPVAILLVVGILSGAVSTVDSIALTLASMVCRDVYRRDVEGGSEARELALGKVVVVVVVAAAAAFATLKLDLISLLAVLSSTGLLITVPIIVGAFFWRRGTAAGALACLVGGTAVVAGLRFGGVDVGLPVSIAGLIAAVVLFVAVSLATRPREKALDFRPVLDEELPRHRVW